MRERLVPLSNWVETANKAGVPMVPALFSPTFPVHELRLVQQGMLPASVKDALDWMPSVHARAAAEDKIMISRWDCCASSELKGEAARGFTPYDRPDRWVNLNLDDPRVLDCTVGEETSVVVRPWLRGFRWRGFPFELRFFMGETGLRGVSAYYPQAPIVDLEIADDSCVGDTFETEPEVYTIRVAETLHKATEFAVRLWQAGEWPIGFTADFLVQTDGFPIFLEGGPPHIMGDPHSADPCCFPHGQVSGTALAPQPGSAYFNMVAPVFTLSPGAKVSDLFR